MKSMVKAVVMVILAILISIPAHAKGGKSRKSHSSHSKSHKSHASYSSKSSGHHTRKIRSKATRPASIHIHISPKISIKNKSTSSSATTVNQSGTGSSSSQQNTPAKSQPSETSVKNTQVPAIVFPLGSLAKCKNGTFVFKAELTGLCAAEGGILLLAPQK